VESRESRERYAREPFVQVLVMMNESYRLLGMGQPRLATQMKLSRVLVPTIATCASLRRLKMLVFGS